MTDLEEIQRHIDQAIGIRPASLPEAQTFAAIAQAEALLALCKRLDRIVNLDRNALNVVVQR